MSERLRHCTTCLDMFGYGDDEVDGQRGEGRGIELLKGRLACRHKEYSGEYSGSGDLERKNRETTKS